MESSSEIVVISTNSACRLVLALSNHHRHQNQHRDHRHRRNRRRRHYRHHQVEPSNFHPRGIINIPPPRPLNTSSPMNQPFFSFRSLNIQFSNPETRRIISFRLCACPSDYNSVWQHRLRPKFPHFSFFSFWFSCCFCGCCLGFREMPR